MIGLTTLRAGRAPTAGAPVPAHRVRQTVRRLAAALAVAVAAAAFVYALGALAELAAAHRAIETAPVIAPVTGGAR